MTRALLAIVLATLLVAGMGGCSAVEEDPKTPPLEPEMANTGSGQKLMIAPLQRGKDWKEVDTSDEGPRGTFKDDAAKIAGDLRGALEPVFGAGNVLAADPQAAFDDVVASAWSNGCTLLLVPRLERYDAVFVGHNGWWWPNALFVYWYFWVPGWWIADEVYGVDARLSYRIVGVRNEKPFPGFKEARAVDVRSTDDKEVEAGRAPAIDLCEMDRGFDFLGVYRPGKLDRGQWEKVTQLLEPYARRWLAAATARDVASQLKQGDFAKLSEQEKTKALAATHALVVGIGRYSAADECRFADSDARAFADWIRAAPESAKDDGSIAAPSTSSVVRRLARGGVAPKKNVMLKLDGAAERAAVVAALDAAVTQTRPEDTYAFYFAGRGIELGAGAGLARLGLVFAGASADDVAKAARQGTPPDVLTLADLAKKLAAIPARRKLVILDCGFGGGPRAIGPISAKPADREALRRELAAALFDEKEGRRGAAILAAAPGDVAYVLDAVKSGLLTYGLVEGLAHEDPTTHALASLEDLDMRIERSVRWIADLEMMDAQERPLVVSNDLASPVFDR